jgi:hypothetical protein
VASISAHLARLLEYSLLANLQRADRNASG